MATTGTLSQGAFVLHLEFHEGDQFSASFTVESLEVGGSVDWSGNYRAQIRRAQSKTSPLLATLTWSGVVNGSVTDFTVVGDTSQVPAGEWYYDAQLENGVTRFRGRVKVEAEVTG